MEKEAVLHMRYLQQIPGIGIAQILFVERERDGVYSQA